MAQEAVRPATPPYISFRTLETMLDRLAEAGIPQRIDRSFWGRFLAGGLGAQTITAMKWLRLLEGEHNEPTPLLDELVNQKERRQATMARIIEERYAPIFETVELPRVTPGHLDREFREHYRVDGDTLRKVVAFFIHAAQFAELPVSPLLLKKTRTTRSAAKTGARPAVRRGKPEVVAAAPQDAPPATVAAPAAAGAGDTRTIQLRGGGEITLSLSISLFRLRGVDREFVFDLLDRLQDYEDAVAAGADEEDEPFELAEPGAGPEEEPARGAA